MKNYRINVVNWQGDSSVLQITNGVVVLQSSGKLEDTFQTIEEAKKVKSAIPDSRNYGLSIEKV